MLPDTSPSARPPSLAQPDFARLVLVTLAALAAFRIGNLIPIPGLDPAGLDSAAAGPHAPLAIKRLSLLALGIIPLFNALLLAELGKLLLPAVRFDKAVLPAALIFAIFQAAGVASALQDVPNLVTEPSRDFQLTATATLAAGAALSMWLAKLITQRGLGNGFWWLFAMPQVMALPGMINALFEAARTGAISTAALSLTLAVTIGIIAVVSMVLRPGETDGTSDDADLLWPPILGAWLAGFLAVPGWVFATSSFGETWLQIFAPGQPWVLVVSAVFVAVIALVYARRRGRADAASRTAVLASIVVVPQVLMSQFQMPWLLTGSTLLILTVLLAPIVRRVRA